MPSIEPGSGVSRAPATLEFPGSVSLEFRGGRECRAIQAIPGFLAYPVFRATREIPAGRVNLAFPGCREFRDYQAFLVNQGFLAPQVFRATPAFEQLHNWPRSMQTRLWQRKNFYSRLIS